MLIKGFVHGIPLTYFITLEEAYELFQFLEEGMLSHTSVTLPHPGSLTGNPLHSPHLLSFFLLVPQHSPPSSIVTS